MAKPREFNDADAFVNYMKALGVALSSFLGLLLLGWGISKAFAGGLARPEEIPKYAVTAVIVTTLMLCGRIGRLEAKLKQLREQS